jgi:hypothetical protein
MLPKIPPDELAGRFESIIARHSALRSGECARLKDIVSKLLPAFQDARSKWAKSQEELADDFNLFEVLRVDGDEVRHSRALAWLLDCRIERGTHAQGNLGFQLFLKELESELRNEGSADVLGYSAEPNYWVHCEVCGDEARVDIEIAARGRFLIHIENKIWSGEGEDQTGREWRDLLARRKELSVSASACHAIFLTLDGHKAVNSNYRSVGWFRIARILDRFSELAKPPEVKLFARHYAKAVRRLSAAQTIELEAENADVQ